MVRNNADAFIRDPTTTEAYQIFALLNQGREMNAFGVVGMKLVEIYSVLDENGVSDKEDRAELIYLIMECDAEWLKWAAAKMAKGSDGDS